MTPKPAQDKPAGKVKLPRKFIYKKCGKKQWCSAMQQHISFDTRRGLNSVTVINIKTGKTRLIGIRYCMTAKSADRGTMLNSCPWCGEDLQWWESSK